MLSPDGQSFLSGFRAMVAQAAISGLRSASDATIGAMIVRPAALGALDPSAAAPSDGLAIWGQLEQALKTCGTLADPMGHARPVYLDLAIHLQTLGQRMSGTPLDEPVASIVRSMIDELRQRTLLDRDEPTIRPMIDRWLWQWLGWHELSSLVNDPMAASDQAIMTRQLDWWLNLSDGPLHRLEMEESLDFWTYREFCGLHALAHLHQAYPQVVRLDRLRQIARYHVENSQPDNTTNQPWGLPLLAIFDESRMLAQQQFHDTITHAASQGLAVGGIAGLLLADAAIWFSRYS